MKSLRFSLKMIIIWAAIAGALYFALSHHIIFFGWEPRTLRKSKLTLENTFFSTTGMNNEQILSNETLRRAGMGKLLVQMGRISEQELERLTSRFND
jgi:hypothetical protein